MNKKAAELLSIWWFFVLAIIGGGITIGVLTYYSADIDVRPLEADILSQKILECITNQGFLDESFFDENFDIFRECNLDKEIFDSQEYFYFNLSVYGQDNKLLKNITKGAAFETDCLIQLGVEEKVEAIHFPKCVKKKESVLYFENNEIKQGRIEILAGSNQAGRKEIKLK